MDFLRGATSYTYIRDLAWKLYHRLILYSISGRGQAPKKVTATDLFYLHSMDRGATNVLYLLAQYLFRHTEGRKSGVRSSRGHFIRCLAHHFGLVSDDGLRGLSVMSRELPLIDMERQQVATASALEAAEDAPAVDERPHRKEIDNVGGESTIWKSGSVGVLKLQDDCLTRSGNGVMEKQGNGDDLTVEKVKSDD
ncbi:hypothetical protein Tco_0680423 [Tanacetum coccineum]|uniref:Uncharacterized protein n=1 Tax=Tanacetum coccineum TaxID=301880 RepID=A0ABQ4XKH3_9ASTR